MNEKKGDGKDISKMISEIEDEFDELDNLLKDIDEMKINQVE